MRRIILMTALLSLSFISAQIDLSNTRYGITIGPNYGGVKNAHNPSGQRLGFFGGVFALIPLDYDDMYYLQPEVLYLSAGETGKDDAVKNKPGYNAKYVNNYISVPINIKIYFSEYENEFFAFGGPRFDFLISQKVKNPSRPAYEINNYGKANSFNLDLGLGIGYSYRRYLEIYVKYDAGLSNTYPYLKNAPSEIETGDYHVPLKKSEQMVSLGLSYIFE